MQLLSDFDPADQVSQLLRVIRIRSTLYCRSLLAAPWGFGVEAHGNPAFHIVTAGRCWADVDGEPDQIALAAGDLLLTQALRAALNQLRSSGGGGLPTLSDRRIASAIEVIHSQPEHRWSVGELASKVALSRSAFSARFRELAGEPPQHYMTRTRLAHAAALLFTTDAPLAPIAVRAGYTTEFSFGKAFKRTVGIAPGAYRGQPGAPRVQPYAAPDRSPVISHSKND